MNKKNLFIYRKTQKMSSKKMSGMQVNPSLEKRVRRKISSQKKFDKSVSDLDTATVILFRRINTRPACQGQDLLIFLYELHW